ncbi:hypothetical protein AB8R14_27845, partial [Klebsiella pneumoniae subsp. ozaenae]
CVEQDDKGRDARKRAYCLKIQPATGSFARNLIYSTKPLFISNRRKSIAARSPRINPQLHLSDPHLTPKSLAYAPVRERFFYKRNE